MMLAYFSHLIILEGRGGYFTFVLLSPVIFYNIFHGRKVVWIFVACFVALGIMYSSPIVRHRMNQANQDLQHHLNSNSEDKWGEKYSDRLDRIYMWRWAIKLFGQHPLLGVGTGGYRQAILAAGGEAGMDHPHNNFLYIAVSFGTAGLFIFGWLFWVLLKEGWKGRNNAMGFFVMASSLVLLIGGLSETHILDSGGAFLLSVTTGLQSTLEDRTSGKECLEINGA
jgi:O-antigen ligase